MKKIILLALTALMMVGCFNEKNPDGTYTTTTKTKQGTYIIDSCEYIGYLGFGNGDVLAHKGNCRFCKERRQKELKELIERLKEK